MNRPVCNFGQDRLFLGVEFGVAALSENKISDGLRDKLAELHQVQPEENRLAELLVVAPGPYNTYYIAYKTQKGEYRHVGQGLPRELNEFLFRKPGIAPLDFETLQVQIPGVSAFFAQDKNGSRWNNIGRDAHNLLLSRPNLEQFPRVFAVTPGWNGWVFIGYDGWWSIQLPDSLAAVKNYLSSEENRNGLQALIIDPSDSRKCNHFLAVQGGYWSGFYRGRNLSGKFPDLADQAAITELRTSKENAEKDLEELKQSNEQELRKLKDDLNKEREALQQQHQRALEIQREQSEKTGNAAAQKQMEDLRIQHERELNEQKALGDKFANEAVRKQLDNVQAKHTKELQEQKYKNQQAQQELENLKIQHKKEMEDLEASHNKELESSSQPNGVVPEEANGDTTEIQRQHKAELERLTKDFEEKLRQKDKEMNERRGSIVNKKWNPFEYSQHPTTIGTALPGLGSMSMYFSKKDYQLGDAISHAWQNELKAQPATNGQSQDGFEDLKR